MAGIFISCNKDASLPNNGEPRIRYVRVTDPVSSDSLLVGAYQSNMIAIVGENLQGTREIWFNDQKATLTPTFITATSILVTTPSQIPTVIDNKMKLVMASGDTLFYPFKILIKEPLVSSMYSEYVAAGDVAIIRGDYFYKPLTVTFPGGGVGELVSVEDKVIKVKVPASAQPGQLTVTSNFGATKSDFWFRDNRNIFISSDPWSGWWGSSLVVTTPASDGPPLINGNYIRVKQAFTPWNWFELAGGPPDAMGAISKNIPDEAITKPADYNFKFELCTKKPFNGSWLRINAGLTNDFYNDQYLWKPPYDTKGAWETIVIPYDEIVTSYGKAQTVSTKGYYSRILLQGPGDLDCDMSFDNFRIVPKVIKK
jgi:hypothetical protein